MKFKLFILFLILMVTNMDAAAFAQSLIPKESYLEIAKEIREELQEKEREEKREKFIRSIPLSEEEQEFIYDQCVENEVPYDTFLAVLYHESRFRKDVVGGPNYNSTYDYGICQINSSNFSFIGEQIDTKINSRNILDFEINIRAGITIYKASEGYADQERENLVHDTLNIYNMGIGNFIRANSPKERNYSNSIVETAKRIKEGEDL